MKEVKIIQRAFLPIADNNADGFALATLFDWLETQGRNEFYTLDDLYWDELHLQDVINTYL